MVASTTATGSSGSTPLSSSAIDMAEQKELFLKLLVAQMKNQDPTDPMDQKDMMGQMAQFSSVEQLTNMARSLESMQFASSFGQSISLIGHTVDYLGANGAIVRGGQVQSVSAAGGVLSLIMSDGTKVAPGNVVEVR